MTETNDSLPANTSDRAITSMVNDGSFRVMVVSTTQTVREAAASQKIDSTLIKDFCDLLTGTILVRLTMAPAYRVQGVLRGQNGHGSLVADAHPDGGTRGLLQSPDGNVKFGPGTQLHMMRHLMRGQTHQGVVEIEGEFGMSELLTTYMLESEQIATVVGVGSVFDANGNLVRAGGWVVQLLPECKEPPLAVMYERMRTDFADAGEVLTKFDSNIETIMSEILWDMPYTPTLEHALVHRCYCSYERMLAGMSSIGSAALQEMIDKGEPLFLTCQWCNKDYELQVETLRPLLEQS